MSYRAVLMMVEVIMLFWNEHVYGSGHWGGGSVGASHSITSVLETGTVK